jgi:flagellar motor switch protein FliM
VDVSLISVDQVSYLEFLKLVSDPTLFCALSMPPMRGNLGIELSPPLSALADSYSNIIGLTLQLR